MFVVEEYRGGQSSAIVEWLNGFWFRKVKGRMREPWEEIMLGL